MQHNCNEPLSGWWQQKALTLPPLARQARAANSKWRANSARRESRVKIVSRHLWKDEHVSREESADKLTQTTMFLIKFRDKSSKLPILRTQITAKHLKPTCLLVLIILLVVVQLRAIELSAPDEPPRGERTNLDESRQVVSSRNEGNLTATSQSLETRQQIGIDRHDFAQNGNIPTQLNWTNGDTKLLRNNNGSRTESLAYKSAGESRDSRVDKSSPANVDGETLDDLLVAPATQQVQSVDGASSERPEQQLDNGLWRPAAAALALPFELHQQRQVGLDLERAAALGTQTGLLVRDLMSRANELSATSLAPDAQVEQSRRNAVEEAPQQFEDILQVRDGVAAAPAHLGHLDEFDERQANNLASVAPAVRVADEQSDSSEAAERAPEPSGEEQMPDSIESLMGPDGEDLDADGQQQEASGGQEENPQQAVSGSNLVNLQPGGGNNLAIEEEDDDEEGGAEAASAQLLDGQSAPVLTSTRYVSQAALSARGNPPQASRAGQTIGLDQTLVAPMRDTLSDLNAAAGHYYGKKKKKKVKKVKKKIVIKKKKKKKKKKYVKVKIVKKYKKKKVPKKRKPKKMHHHDHGKYYMYAKVPKKKAWEFGFKKGNKKHWIERHEKGHKNKFKTKVKWYDKKSKGKGIHIWDYNHHDKKKKKHH